MVQGRPAAEVDIDPPLVRALLRRQRPDLAGLPIAPLSTGWDNASFRVGDAVVARLPRRAVAAPLVLHEQRWLPRLAALLPLPVPVPVLEGRPAPEYPWPWSLVRHLPGRPAAHRAGALDPSAPAVLARFLSALHVPAPAAAPANPFRGVPLASRDLGVHGVLAAVAELVDERAVRAAWDAALAAPAHAGPPRWLHGDLHPANLLVDDAGRLTAVLDFGDLTSGDPATDLAAAWMLFPAEGRARFREQYGTADPHLWARARGWALVLGLSWLAHSADDPLMGAIGLRALEAALSDR